VRVARTWIVGELRRLGRDDLVDSAELGVSELVTNAILHADPPIVVRLGGTSTHPRVEVHDGSVLPPSVRDMTDRDRLLATIGRGLGLVAMYSVAWGAEVSPRGKLVWFEPGADWQADHGPVVGDVFDLTGRVEELVAAAGDPEEQTTVRLVGMPVRVFAHYRNWYEELRRELRLLSLTHGEHYPVASELSELALRVEQQRRQARGVDAMDAAIGAGQDCVDLEYRVPVSAPATMARLRDLLEQVDVFCREQWLLTLAPNPQQLMLRTWDLGEFERQGRGEAPLPWPGTYVVEDPAG
jgi:hypothetical protein